MPRKPQPKPTRRIELTPGFHAEPGETPGHLHSVFTTRNLPQGMQRISVGQLNKAAVESWANAASVLRAAAGEAGGSS